MALSERELEMVAVGASIGANCIPCLEWHGKKCFEIGVDTDELQQAVELAMKVKGMPHRKIELTATRLVNRSADESEKTDAPSEDEAPCC